MCTSGGALEPTYPAALDLASATIKPASRSLTVTSHGVEGPRRYEDYRVAVDESGLPAGVTVEYWLDPRRG